jgi:RNA polymerase sigma-70 factor, ECF subfamily
VDDSRLLRRLLQGDEDAFQEFFDTHFPRLYRFALTRVADEDAAEDIVQATLIQAIRKLSTFRGEAALFTWLVTICRREISAWFERAGRRSTVSLEEDLPDVRARLEALANLGAGADEAVHRQEIARLVRVALDFLPARYGDVLEWKYIDEQSVADIAARLDLSPKAAESMLTRARHAFREAFAALTGPSGFDFVQAREGRPFRGEGD